MHNRQIKNDPQHGTIGYGKKYGEQSYNNEPIRKELENFDIYTSVPSTSFWKSYYDGIASIKNIYSKKESDKIKIERRHHYDDKRRHHYERRHHYDDCLFGEHHHDDYLYVEHHHDDCLYGEHHHDDCLYGEKDKKTIEKDSFEVTKWTYMALYHQMNE